MKTSSPFLWRAFWRLPGRIAAIANEVWEEDAPLEWLVDGQSVAAWQKAPSSYWKDWSGYCALAGNQLLFVCELDEDESAGHREIYLSGTFNDWKGLRDPQWRLERSYMEGRLLWQIRAAEARCLKSTEGGIYFKFVAQGGRWIEPPGRYLNRVLDEKGNVNLELHPLRTGRALYWICPHEAPNPFHPHTLEAHSREKRSHVEISGRQLLFGAGTERRLGSYVQAGQTTFALFAPRAFRARVFCNRSLEGAYTPFAMEQVEPYVWEVSLKEDLTGAYYYYTLEGEAAFFNPEVKILDPYALACVGPAGPSIVRAPAYNTPKIPFNTPPWQDLIIAEAHVRDLIALASETLSDRLGFTGLTEWLEAPSCYLKKLGVNAVELQPVQQFDGEDPRAYHWGYMPVQYFCPASQYCLHPEKSSAASEMKALVQAFHQANLAVIVDVVYNHMGNPNGLYHIDADYFFRRGPDGQLSNWSGCGNDLRCDTPMGLRLIIESLVHWIREFDVDGFRFDLAELMGIPALRQIEKALKAVKPGIVLIAEPWSFRGHIGHALKETGYTSWNDDFREFIFKYVRGQGNAEGLEYFLRASSAHLTNWAAQTVNYVESHDDFCWMDRITENPGHDALEPTAWDIRRTHLMMALLMVSLGIPMMAAGQDFLRTKRGVHNTYQRGDLNALDYARITEFPSSADYMRAWIRFRRSKWGKLLRYDGAVKPEYMRFYRGPYGALGVLYNADRSIKNPKAQLFFAINPHSKAAELSVPEVPLDHFLQLADHERFNEKGLTDAKMHFLDPFLHIPSGGCGLWLLADD